VMPCPWPTYILSLNIISNLFRFHDAGSVKRFMYCMKFTSKGNQENHKFYFKKSLRKEKWSCGVLYNN